MSIRSVLFDVKYWGEPWSRSESTQVLCIIISREDRSFCAGRHKAARRTENVSLEDTGTLLKVMEIG